MTTPEYIPPKFLSDGFNCPHCNIYAHQKWYKPTKNSVYNYIKIEIENSGPPYFMWISECDRCHQKGLWDGAEEIKDGILLYPHIKTAPLPNIDMPENVKKLYKEAREISDSSQRSAAALLRCSLEQLLTELGEEKGSLYDRIIKLSEKGILSEKCKDLAQLLRIYGNEAGAHIGEIDLSDIDSKENVNTLFEILNMITEETITQQKKIGEMWDAVPLKKRPDDRKQSDT